MFKISTIKKLILKFLLIITSVFSYSQAQTIELEAKGVFGQIDVKSQHQAIDKIKSKDKKEKEMIIKNIKENPNDYSPPVLYMLSHELFEQGNKDEACYWFYLAQLRARYDANLCMDESAKEAVTILNEQFGPKINRYAFQDINKLETIIIKVVNFVRENKENYDHRWINLHGMWAITAGLNSKEETRELSKPKEEWEEIKKKTVDDYFNGFIKYVKNQNQ